jgi:NADH dehydrogenase FAD-containing subunit
MRNILILGAGAGGTIVANMLRRELPEAEWRITIIDRDERHHYQPGHDPRNRTHRAYGSSGGPGCPLAESA